MVKLRPTQIPDDGIGVKIPFINIKMLRLSYIDPAENEKPHSRDYYKEDCYHHPPDERYPLLDHFPVFRCQWHGCTSKLHNLKTLRRHVGTQHHRRYNDPDVPVECLWRGCCEDTEPGLSLEDHEMRHSESRGRSVAHLQALKEHMEESHFTDVVRSLGDGPISQSRCEI